MAKVSITEAARLAGVTRQTLYKRYFKPTKNGDPLLTVETTENGTKCIDTAELLRVFGSLKGDTGNSNQSVNSSHEATRQNTREFDMLQAQVKALQEQLEESKEREAWMRDKVDQLTDQLKLVEHKPEENKGFWARVFNK